MFSIYNLNSNRENRKQSKFLDKLTQRRPSLAERATISAQETVFGHSFSSACLIVSIYLKFLIPKFLGDSFSDSSPFAVSKYSDASHDCKFFF